jgi:hypothetical protein
MNLQGWGDWVILAMSGENLDSVCVSATIHSKQPLVLLPLRCSLALSAPAAEAQCARPIETFMRQMKETAKWSGACASCISENVQMTLGPDWRRPGGWGITRHARSYEWTLEMDLEISSIIQCIPDHTWSKNGLQKLMEKKGKIFG